MPNQRLESALARDGSVHFFILAYSGLSRNFASAIDRKVIGDSSNSKNDFRHIGRLSVMMSVLFVFPTLADPKIIVPLHQK